MQISKNELAVIKKKRKKHQKGISSYYSSLIRTIREQNINMSTTSKKRAEKITTQQKRFHVNLLDIPSDYKGKAAWT